MTLYNLERETAERTVYMGKVFSYQPNASLIPEESVGSSKCGRERQMLMERRRLYDSTAHNLVHGNYQQAGMRVETLGRLILALELKPNLARHGEQTV